MLRSLTALVATSLVGACAQTAPVDELAGETAADDVVDGKADSASDGAYTYYEIRTDLRKCVSPLCGGFFVSRLNRSTTRCVDGSYDWACYAPALDWSQTDLSATTQQKLIDAAAVDATTEGIHAIVRGHFASKSWGTFGNLGTFVISEAWVNENAAVSDGVFVKVKDNGVRCITFPCPTLGERALNTSRSANVAEIDWSATGFSDREVAGFYDDIAGDHGAIIAGWRYYDGHYKGRTATAGYHMLVEPAQAACYVGGCSGQVCSDQQGVITTCEWKPEYACYAQATCERQADGTCGWTDTPELDACLAGTH